MAGEEVDDGAFPGEVLHDLAGKFNEVPGDADAGEGGNGGTAEGEVEQVAEFVEQGDDLAMVEQGGFAVERGGDVAGDEAEMGLELAFGVESGGPNGAHPGAGTLVFAGVEVEIEVREECAVAVVDGEVLDGGVPDGGVGDGFDLDAEDASGVGKHAVEDLVHGQIGANLLFVEVVEGFAELFGVVGEVPGFEGGGVGAFEAAAEGLEFGGFLFESGAGLFIEGIEEFEDVAAGLGHAGSGLEVGEGGEAEQGGFFAAEFEDLLHNGAVIEGRGGGDRGAGVGELAADGGVVEEAEGGEVAWSLEGEAPPGFAFGSGAGGGGAAGGFGESGELAFVGEEEFEGVGGVEDVLAEAGAEGSEAVVDGLEAGALGIVEVGAIAAEAVEGESQGAGAGPVRI